MVSEAIDRMILRSRSHYTDVGSRRGGWGGGGVRCVGGGRCAWYRDIGLPYNMPLETIIN